jgi:putative colanic acid biosynthesis UDP-glucose lipid carrier transferase
MIEHFWPYDLSLKKDLPEANELHQDKKNDYTLTLIRDLIYLPSPLNKKRNRYTKRAVDVVFSFFTIMILFPWLLPVLAILIKLNSRGPVFFLQKRNKKNGAVFNCLKLRTMIINNDADTRSTTINDDRITSFGRFLRHSHLDELPQLINVFLGDMSLIGPRPHMISENILFQKTINEYSYRNEAKPGITGLSQSLGNFGSITDVEKIKERLLLDLLYIKHWSVKMEVKIIFRTIRELMPKIKTESDSNKKHRKVSVI